MALPYDDLVRLRRTDPAWRLLTADRAPVIASFLDRAFREGARRTWSESELVVLLEDVLFDVQALEGADAVPRSPGEYLTEWAQDDKGWLRKFYPPGEDEAHFDLSPAAERALGWLDSLFERGFIGTESRLLTAVHLLEQIVEGVEEDADERIRRLEEQRGAIDRQIAAIRAGDIPVLDDRSLRERFLQFARLARELLADFRAVEHRFRELDRDVRTRIAGWEGDKATLLREVFGERDVIADSDEGRSFRAFWDFLMTPESQERLSQLLDRTFAIEALRRSGGERGGSGAETSGEAGGTEQDAVRSDVRDERLRRVHYDWITAGEHTQRTVARLSQQLRRFLDDQAYLENRRIIEILNTIGRHGLVLADEVPKGNVMEIDGVGSDISLPLERPLASPVEDEEMTLDLDGGEEVDLDLSVLFDQVYVDTARLQRQIDLLLEEVDQVSLATVIDRHPLRDGLAELVGYLAVASESSDAVIDDARRDRVVWTGRGGVTRRARVPVVVFRR
ncbi:MAG: DUF3375 domain-containing protein, partial [Alkalispirochaeta sp.]